MISSGVTGVGERRDLGHSEPGFDYPSGCPEITLTLLPADQESADSCWRRLAQRAADLGVDFVGMLVYVAHGARAEYEGAFGRVFGDADWPMSWIEVETCGGVPLAGVQAFALRDTPITRVGGANSVVASVYEIGGARIGFVGGITPGSISAAPAEQAKEVFDRAEAVLALAGFALRDVVRTWFYNDDIVSWYGDFNRVRGERYAGQAWRSGALPASTGIGARNPAAAALSFTALALRPVVSSSVALASEPRFAYGVASPGQCPATVYGSSFSRAVELDYGGRRRLLVSGTASIYPDGTTAWIDDAAKQVWLTMDVVQAILTSRRMSFECVTRAVAYFKSGTDARYLDAWLADRGLQRMPIVPICAEVCRSELLFEIEVDAVA